MTRHRHWIATCSLVALGALAGPLLFSELDARKLRSSAADDPEFEIVPIELVLLVDTSSSVDDDEYDLQKQGYEEAFRSAELTAVIEEQGGIAVAYIEWSSADHQNIRIDWTLLKSPDDCMAFANEIAVISRDNSGSTMLAPALDFAATHMNGNAYYGLKRVIDVSGDGRCKNYDYYVNGIGDEGDDYGIPWDNAISNISAIVSQVNGICITGNSEVIEFYEDALPLGETAFAMQVDDFDQFEDAILDKLLREVNGLPGLFD